MTKHSLAVVLLLGILPSSSSTAVEELADLRRQADAMRKSGDLQARLQVVLKVQQLLNDAPDALEITARAYAEVGDSQHALATLEEFAEQGQVDDALLNGTDTRFDKFKQLPKYKSVLDRVAANKQLISRAEKVFQLSDSGVLPEDIAYDDRSHTFLITSVLEKKIIRVSADGHAMDFASSPSHWPMFAIKIDAANKLVWATETAVENFDSVPKTDWGNSAVLCFDLKTGNLLHRINAPHMAIGDMVLSKEGEPIVSDGEGGGIYRVSHNRLELLNNKDFISPQTPTLLGDGDQMLVPDYARGIAKLDLKTGQVIWLDASDGGDRPHHFASSGVDGLYFSHGSLFVTQNGTSLERVMRFKLDRTLSHITSQQIIEQATSSLGDPTHGVIVGDYFYYIANSGWNALDEHGKVKTGATLTPALLMRYKLP